jgi:hypothetical protein
VQRASQLAALCKVAMADFSPSTIATNGNEAKHKNAQRNAEHTRNKKKNRTNKTTVRFPVYETYLISITTKSEHTQ